MDYKILIDQIMQLDENIRFSIVSDMYGNIVTTRHREGLANFLSEDETKDSLQYAVEAWRIRHSHANKIGRGKFAIVEYEKIRRITIPLSEDRLLLITLDNIGELTEIIEKILKQIQYPKPEAS